VSDVFLPVKLKLDPNPDGCGVPVPLPDVESLHRSGREEYPELV
jgi:hypothetical protein